jgi:nitroreductase
MTQKEIQNALEWRYATKRFDPSRKLNPEDWKVLESSLLLAPSSYGLQPWKFLVVENPGVRAELREVSWKQGQVTDASRFVVLVHKENVDEDFVRKYLQRISEVRGVSTESLDGFYQMLMQNVVQGKVGTAMSEWTRRQTYIAMGFLMESAALLKIDACPMEGLDPEAYDRILGLHGSGWKTAAAVALGYRHPEDAYQNATKVRFSNEAVVEYRK